jgi:hypothetical protein
MHSKFSFIYIFSPSGQDSDDEESGDEEDESDDVDEPQDNKVLQNKCICNNCRCLVKHFHSSPLLIFFGLPPLTH